MLNQYNKLFNRLTLNNYMKTNEHKLLQLYSQSDALFLELSAYFKKFMHDHKKNRDLTIEERKILKVFNFTYWQDFMKWVDEKLEQGGQLNETKEEDKQPLPEIIQEEADLEESITSEPNNLKMVKCEWLAIQNAKMRKANIILSDKIQRLKRQLQHNQKNKSSV